MKVAPGALYCPTCGHNFKKSPESREKPAHGAQVEESNLAREEVRPRNKTMTVLEYHALGKSG